MDKNLEDMEKMFEELDFDFFDDNLEEEENEEVNEALKSLIKEIEEEEDMSNQSDD